MTSEWGRATYGDPCRECGYEWSISRENALAFVASIPETYAELLASSDGSERHPDLSWSAAMYVCHVADNLRIWAERLAGIALGGSTRIEGYDQDLLSEARRYGGVGLEGALWSLRRAVADWQDAVDLATRKEALLVHPDRGEQTVLDVIRTNTHDAYHHRWDIERSLG